MTLRCSNCGSYALAITSQSYSDTSAFEAYECEHCGATGSLRHEDRPPRTELSGDIECDGGRGP
jgi:DNA-directed RNA polymerase subunit RPC12/RpoP